jgi:AcrR family transcriptional regulator
MTTVGNPSIRRRRRTRVEAREDNRRALLTAARELIVEVGYSSAQLDQIAERAGLTKGAIYSIFGGKEELLRALADEHAGQYLPLLEAGFDAEPHHTAEDVIEGLGRSYARLIDRPDALALLAFELELSTFALRDPATLETARASERALTDRLAAVLAGRARRAGPPLSTGQAEVAADLVLGALGGLGQRAVAMPWSPRTPEVVAAALVRLMPDPRRGEQ